MKRQPEDDEIDRRLRAAAGCLSAVTPEAPRWTWPHDGSPRRVRPARSGWVRAVALWAAIAAVAGMQAAGAGLDGIRALGAGRAFIMLAVLGALTVAMARLVIERWTPGSRIAMAPAAAICGCCACLVVAYRLLLQPAESGHFVGAGLACLSAGLLHAVPSILIGLLVLRRGFVIRPLPALLMLGALAGVSGVAFLEAHCTDLDVLHRVVWHSAVVPLAAVTGLGGLLMRRR